MWIEESIKKGNKMRDHFSLSGIDVFVKDQLPREIDTSFVFEYIRSRIPFFFMSGIDIIYIGQFPMMKKRDINAYFEDGAIYVTNDQDDEMDMIEDIIHEISHAVESNHQEFIYSTGAIQREFIAKRARLNDLLSQKFNVPKDFNTNFEYDKGIDDFLYRNVGYDALNQICVNIFPSAYAVTSLSEYWAKGFEELFIGDPAVLRDICPVLFRTLVTLLKDLDEET
tara:strand:+ start:83 stop:757 length:675 start_codon:yes stop_codon:yes gene_type:complete